MNYIFTENKKSTKWGGFEVSATIYKLVRNRAQKIGIAIYDTRMHKGNLSEVFKKLFELGEVSKKEYNRFGGYYYRGLNNLNIDLVC